MTYMLIQRIRDWWRPPPRSCPQGGTCEFEEFNGIGPIGFESIFACRKCGQT